MQPRRLGQERLREIGVGLEQITAHEAAGGTRFAVFFQKQVQPLRPARGPVLRRQPQPFQHPLGQDPGGRRAGVEQCLGGGGQPVRRCPIGAARPKRGGVIARIDPQRAYLRGMQGRRRHRGDRRQAFRICPQRPHQRRKTGKRGQARDLIQRRAPAGIMGVRQHVLARLGQRILGVAVLDQFEIGRQPGLQREPAQQRLAERVDGADPHPARQVQHAREKRPRILPGGPGGNGIEVAQPRIECIVVEAHPLAERSVEADRHFGCRRFGEGEALNARRLRAAQHQPE